MHEIENNNNMNNAPFRCLMITFYDGASGRTRVTELSTTTNTTTSSNNGSSRIDRIRERLAELTRGPHTNHYWNRIESTSID